MEALAWKFANKLPLWPFSFSFHILFADLSWNKREQKFYVQGPCKRQPI